MKFYIAKIVEAKNILDAIRKEKTVEPYDIRRTTEDGSGVSISTIGFSSPEPLEDDD